MLSNSRWMRQVWSNQHPLPTDGANAVISSARGNYSDAGLSALGMIPYAGDLAKGGKYLDEAPAGAKLGRGQSG